LPDDDSLESKYVAVHSAICWNEFDWSVCFHIML